MLYSSIAKVRDNILIEDDEVVYFFSNLLLLLLLVAHTSPDDIITCTHLAGKIFILYSHRGQSNQLYGYFPPPLHHPVVVEVRDSSHELVRLLQGRP